MKVVGFGMHLRMNSTVVVSSQVLQRTLEGLKEAHGWVCYARYMFLMCTRIHDDW